MGMNDTPSSERLNIGLDVYKRQTKIDLVKNDNYWGGDVKVDKVTVKSFADGSALTAALQTGDRCV